MFSCSCWTGGLRNFRGPNKASKITNGSVLSLCHQLNGFWNDLTEQFLSLEKCSIWRCVADASRWKRSRPWESVAGCESRLCQARRHRDIECFAQVSHNAALHSSHALHSGLRWPIFSPLNEVRPSRRIQDQAAWAYCRMLYPAHERFPRTWSWGKMFCPTRFRPSGWGGIISRSLLPLTFPPSLSTCLYWMASITWARCLHCRAYCKVDGNPEEAEEVIKEACQGGRIIPNASTYHHITALWTQHDQLHHQHWGHFDIHGVVRCLCTRTAYLQWLGLENLTPDCEACHTPR